MKKKLFLFLFFVAALFVSCVTKTANFGIATTYLPPSSWLNVGIANKYYIHHKKNDSYDTSTNIEYRTFQMPDAKQLIQQHYNPAFQLISTKKFSFENDQMVLKQERQIFRKDTLNSIITKPIYKDWSKPNVQFEKSLIFEWGSRTWTKNQLAIKDTTVLNKPAKIFENQLTYQQIYQADTTLINQQIKEVYGQDLGLFYAEIIADNSTTIIELVEQIPLTDFHKMSKHDRHRVAYIDTTKILDVGTTFQPCGINNYIYDYYNGQKEYHYKGGKKEIWRTIRQNLNEEKLFKESGYLNFRFVVNCKGTAGYFVTEQADLDFQKKQFHQATIQHFFEIVNMLKEWNPTEIRKEKVDAYFYLTFKLEHGELIEILP